MKSQILLPPEWAYQLIFTKYKHEHISSMGISSFTGVQMYSICTSHLLCPKVRGEGRGGEGRPTRGNSVPAAAQAQSLPRPACSRFPGTLCFWPAAELDLCTVSMGLSPQNSSTVREQEPVPLNREEPQALKEARLTRRPHSHNVTICKRRGAGWAEDRTRGHGLGPAPPTDHPRPGFSDSRYGPSEPNTGPCPPPQHTALSGKGPPAPQASSLVPSIQSPWKPVLFPVTPRQGSDRREKSQTTGKCYAEQQDGLPDLTSHLTEASRGGPGEGSDSPRLAYSEAFHPPAELLLHPHVLQSLRELQDP